MRADAGSESGHGMAVPRWGELINTLGEMKRLDGASLKVTEIVAIDKFAECHMRFRQVHAACSDEEHLIRSR
jgi:hypothetical protein